MRPIAAVSPLLALLAVGCALAPGRPACDRLTPDRVDQCLRLNQLQLLGTHNSYHVQPSGAVREAIAALRPGWIDDLDYSHRPLTEQLAELNIRQLELDVFADPAGGRYLTPVARRRTGLAPAPGDPRMARPGFKVLHIQDLDYGSTCPTLVACLEEVERWSRSHPRHLPILILVEVKDSPLRDTLGIAFTVPAPIREPELDALDAEIRSVFDEEHLLTPDDVRRDHSSLEQAIQREGWPSLARSRGRVLFALDNTGVHRDEYLRSHPGLEGRVMFTSSPPGQPTAAFVKMNEAPRDLDLIRTYVGRGYLVRTRSDIPVREARTGDTSRRDAALSSGAQYVSTDYPERSPFGSGYQVTLPGAPGRPARCNPLTAPPGCRDEWIVE